jgi:hypothetical protein
MLRLKIQEAEIEASAGRLRDYVGKDVKQLMTPSILRGFLGIISIVALLAENCDFDSLRKDHEGRPCVHVRSHTVVCS